MSIKYVLLKRKRLLIGLLFLTLVGVGVAAAVRSFTKPKTAVVRSEAVDRGTVEIKVTETGTIEPLKKVEVKSKVAGRITRLYVQEGSPVKAGQLLVDIDPTEINSQVDQMLAQLDGAKARHEQARRGALYQAEQTRTGIRQYREALRAAQARLKSAQVDHRVQPRLSNSDVSGADAGLKAAQDGLALLKASTHPQARVQAQSAFEEAETALENAKRNLDRQQELIALGYVARQDVETARTSHAAAKARHDQAKKRLDLLSEQQRLEVADAQSRVAQARATLERARANRSLLPMKDQDVLSAQAAVEQARAQYRAALAGVQQDRMRNDAVTEARAAVAQLENQLNEIRVRQLDTRLMATMNGVVTKRYIEQGELITSGTSSFSSGTPVLQIADLSRMLVKMTVNEVDVNRIRAGLPVEIRIDGVKGRTFGGRVRKVSPAALGNEPGQGGGDGNNNVIRFAVEVLVDRPDPRLKPGMSAKCTIVIDRRKNVLRLPNDCVTGSGAKAKALVLDPKAPKEAEKGKEGLLFKPRMVIAGLRGDTHIEIVSGLKAGEKVKPGVFSGPKRRAIDIFD